MVKENYTVKLNTLVVKKTLQGNGFSYTSAVYYETHVFSRYELIAENIDSFGGYCKSLKGKFLN